MDRRCSDCQFFQPSPVGSCIGECRLMPPSVPDERPGKRPGLRFLEVFDFNWCGQFEPKEDHEKV